MTWQTHLRLLRLGERRYELRVARHRLVDPLLVGGEERLQLGEALHGARRARERGVERPRRPAVRRCAGRRRPVNAAGGHHAERALHRRALSVESRLVGHALLVLGLARRALLRALGVQDAEDDADADEDDEAQDDDGDVDPAARRGCRSRGGFAASGRLGLGVGASAVLLVEERLVVGAAALATVRVL